MTKHEILKEVKKKSRELELLADDTSKRLKKLPEAGLYISKMGKTTRYIRLQGKERKYLGEAQKEEIEALEKKLYFSKLNKAATQEKDVLERVAKQLEKVEDVESVFLGIPKEKRHLITPVVFVADGEKLKRFKEDPRNDSLDKSTYTTLEGDRVRSKSELIIADRLTYHGVPYAYEPPTAIDEECLEIWHPDFMCMNVRTGETFYWEHFGMMDNKEYCKSFQYKMERFAEIGKFPGEKLIISTESSDHPLSTKYVDLLIEHYLK